MFYLLTYLLLILADVSTGCITESPWYSRWRREDAGISTASVIVLHD